MVDPDSSNERSLEFPQIGRNLRHVDYSAKVSEHGELLIAIPLFQLVDQRFRRAFVCLVLAT